MPETNQTMQQCQHCNCFFEATGVFRYPDFGEHYIYRPTGELEYIDPVDGDPWDPDSDAPFIDKPERYEIMNNAGRA